MSPVHIAISLVLVVGLVGAAFWGADGMTRHDRLRAELERVRSLNAALRDENQRLSSERHALRHDAVYIDAVIRDDLGYIRPDEVILEFR